MSKERINRVLSAMSETVNLLNREMKYQPHLRDEKLIDFYRGHIATLAKMLTSTVEPS